MGKDLFEGRFLTIFRQAYLLGRPIFLDADGEPPGSSMDAVRGWVIGPHPEFVCLQHQPGNGGFKSADKEKKSSF